MSVFKSFRRVGEVAVTGFGLAVIPCLPRRAVVALARGAGALGAALPTLGRRIGLANLALVYGDRLSPAERRRIIRDVHRTFALVLLDLFWFTKRTPRRIDRWVRFDPSFDAHAMKRPLILVTAHFGNWEVLGQAAAHHGCVTASVAAVIQNRPVSRLLNRLRQRTGQRIVEQAGAVKALLKTLKDGQRVALLLDQNTAPGRGGVFVEYFGLPVPISGTAAALSVRTGVPIVPAFCRPAPDGGYVIYARPALPQAEGPDAIQALTQGIARAIEAEVREHPGNWLWLYKRWKYVPREFAREKYPFYAHYVQP